MTDITETDLKLSDGRTLHVYDTGGGGAAGGGRITVFWHHGTPNTGLPPEPLFPVAERLGIRWVSYDRPGYGGSTRRPGRDIASGAAETAAVADALGIERFAVMGHSGGSPHALACGALLPDRVLAVLAVASLAPYDAAGLDYFEGMAASGVASLSSAAAGRAAKEAHVASGAEYDPEFTPADLAALSGLWSWFGKVVSSAVRSGPAPAIDDDLAYVVPWAFSPAQVTAPVLLLHGGADRIAPPGHAQWLAAHCPTAELRLKPHDGHISVLSSAPASLSWLASHA